MKIQKVQTRFSHWFWILAIFFSVSLRASRVIAVPAQPEENYPPVAGEEIQTHSVDGSTSTAGMGDYPGDDAEDSEEGTSLDTSLKGDDDVIQELQNQPMDLNKATEEQLRDLPDVDRRLARGIVRQRAIRKRFRNVEELKAIPGMTDPILEKIRPLVMIQEEGVREAFFAGDTRFRVRNVNPRGSVIDAEPAFQHNTYFYNRTRLRFGSQTQVGWLAKRASAGPGLTPENIQRQVTFKESVQVTDVGMLDKIVLGNYTLSHGQGLVFYDGLGEFVRPAKVKARGARPDFTSGSNEYHKGAALEGRLGPFDASLFVSQKDLDLEVNRASGIVQQPLYSLREMLGDLTDEESIQNNDAVSERLYGGRLAYRFWESTIVGVTGYESSFNYTINPPNTGPTTAHTFRGDKSSVIGVDFDSYYKSLNLFGEVARSRSSGPGVDRKGASAWTATPMFRLAPYYFWMSFFDYDADYFARHSKGVSFAVVGEGELTENQRGVVTGFEYQGKRYKNRTNYTVASFPYSLGSRPLGSEGRQLYFENTYGFPRGVEGYFRYQFKEQDVYLDRMMPKKTQKYRYQATWRASADVRYRVRYETRFEDLPETGERASGYVIMGDVRYKPVRSLTLNARMYYFDSEEAFVTTGVEEIWNKVVYPQLAGSMNRLSGPPGTRFYLIVKQDIGRDLDVWFKYDVNRRPISLRSAQRTQSDLQDTSFGATKQGFHVQIDYKWGGPGQRASGTGEPSVLPYDWSAEQE